MGNCLIHLKKILVKYLLGKGMIAISCVVVRSMSGINSQEKFLQIYPGVLSQLFHSKVILQLYARRSFVLLVVYDLQKLMIKVVVCRRTGLFCMHRLAYKLACARSHTRPYKHGHVYTYAHVLSHSDLGQFG